MLLISTSYEICTQFAIGCILVPVDFTHMLQDQYTGPGKWIQLELKPNKMYKKT